jgi:hypothetical protein
MFPEWDIQLKKVQLHRQIVDAWPDSKPLPNTQIKINGKKILGLPN